MTEAAEENGLLGPEQFGFRQGRSTLDAAFVLSTLLQKAKKKKLPYAVAFIDISKVTVNVNSSENKQFKTNINHTGFPSIQQT